MIVCFALVKATGQNIKSDHFDILAKGTDTLALDLNTNGTHLFIAVSVLEWQRLVLSSWSKSFSRSPEKIFRAVDVQLLVKLTFIYDLSQEFMNLT